MKRQVPTPEEMHAMALDHIRKTGCPLCGGSGYALISIGGITRKEPCPNECAPPVIFGGQS